MIAPGDMCFAQAGTKMRPCVVLRIRSDSALVLIYGTGTARSLPRVEVVFGSAEATAMRLQKTTYFYANNVVALATGAVGNTGAQCPPAVFVKLRRLVGLL